MHHFLVHIFPILTTLDGETANNQTLVKDSVTKFQTGNFLFQKGVVGGAMVLGKLPVPGRPANLD